MDTNFENDETRMPNDEGVEKFYNDAQPSF
jgi:hypothetical protein